MDVIRIYDADPSKSSHAKEVVTIITDYDGTYSGRITIPNTLIGATLYAEGKFYQGVGVASKEGISFTSNGTRSAGANTIGNATWCAAQRGFFMTYLPEKGTVNAGRATKNQSKNNDLVIKKNCNISVGFLYSGAGNYSKLYYYYYKAGVTPTAAYVQNFINADNGSKFLVFGKDNDGTSTGHLRIDSNESGSLPSEMGGYATVSSMRGVNGIIHYFTKPLYAVYDLTYYGDPDNLFNADGTWKGAMSAGKFPATYSIGFALVTVMSYNGLPANESPDALPIVYSYNDLNTKTQNSTYNNANINGIQVARLLSTTSDNTIIMGFEDEAINPVDNQADWTIYKSQHSSYTSSNNSDAYFEVDFDYNDLIIGIASDPDGGIDTPDDEPIPVTTEGTPICGTLMFEDLYPNQGDYDMNDVMIKYSVTPHHVAFVDLSTGDSRNYVDYITCKFFPYCDGATYTNGFRFGLKIDDYSEDEDVAYNTDYKSSTFYTSHKLDEGYMLFPIYDNNLGSLDHEFEQIIYFTDNGKAYLDETDPGTPYFLAKYYLGYEKEIFDPHIHVYDTGYEVHLTGKTATSNAKSLTEAEGYEVNSAKWLALAKYYALDETSNTNQLQFPFAMDIPINNRVEGHKDDCEFRPVTEYIRIDNECTDYIDWVKATSGVSVTTDYENWYTSHTNDTQFIYYPYRGTSVQATNAANPSN